MSLWMRFLLDNEAAIAVRNRVECKQTRLDSTWLNSPKSSGHAHGTNAAGNEWERGTRGIDDQSLSLTCPQKGPKRLQNSPQFPISIRDRALLSLPLLTKPSFAASSSCRCRPTLLYLPLLPKRCARARHEVQLTVCLSSMRPVRQCTPYPGPAARDKCAATQELWDVSLKFSYQRREQW